MLDAYSIKKMAPRILIGIILINLSLYLVVAATEVTRITARGAAGLITQPFVEDFNFDLGDSNSATQTIGLGAGLFAAGYFLYKGGTQTGTTIYDTIGNIFDRESTRQQRQSAAFNAMHMFIFLVVMPIALIMLAVMITLIFRQGLLIFLAVVAPVACALYILPSTDKYFKKWWELFSKTLLMYPIIMAIFALADVLASIIFRNNPGSLPGTLAGLIAMFAPLALIPFSFKFAGGAMTAIYGAMTTGRGKLGEMGPLKRQRERAQENWQTQKVQANMKYYRRSEQALGKIADKVSEIEGIEKQLQNPNLSVANRQRLNRKLRAARQDLNQMRRGGREWLHRTRKSAIGNQYYEQEAMLNKKAGEKKELIIGYGDDSEYRAATATWTEDPSGSGQMGWYSLAGQKFSEQEVMAARRSMGNDQYKLQQALAHEQTKAMTEGQHDALIARLPELQQQLGLADEEMNSVLIGAGFMMKGKTLQWKRLMNETDANGNTVTNFNGREMVKEQYTNMGTYQAMAQDPDNFRVLTMIGAEAIDVVNSSEAEIQAQQQIINNPASTQAQKDAAIAKIQAAKSKRDEAKDTIGRLQDIASGMKSQIAAAGGSASTAYAQAMQQTGQEPQAGASAAADEAITGLITLMDHTSVSTGQGGTLKAEVADTDVAIMSSSQYTNRQTELQNQVNQINAAIAQAQAQGASAIDIMSATNQRDALQKQLNSMQQGAQEEAAKVAKALQQAQQKKANRNYGSIKV